MKRFLTLIAFAAAMVILLPAAELSGKWQGAFDFNGSPVPLTFDLKTDGAKLTGTVVGLPGDTPEIKEGKFEDGAVAFWMMTEYQGSPVKLVYKGKLENDELKLTMASDDGSFSVDFVVKKSS